MQTQALKALEEARTQAYETYHETIKQSRKPCDEAIEQAYYAYLDADVQLRKAHEEADADEEKEEG